MRTNTFFIILFITTLIFMGILYQPFLFTFFIALLLVFSTQSIKKLLDDIFDSHLTTSIISTVMLAILLFAPIVYVITVSAITLQQIDPEVYRNVIPAIKKWIADAPEFLHFFLHRVEPYLKELNLSELASNGIKIAAGLGAKSAGFLKDIFLITIFYFFITYYDYLLKHFFIHSIKSIKSVFIHIGDSISNVMGVVFYSILATAIFEGTLFAIMAYYFGYDPFLFGILYGVASLIPVIGGILMWLPLSLYEISFGHTTNALIIAVYTIVVISIVADTFIKPLIIKQINDVFLEEAQSMDELLIFFSMIAGLSTFGFWGVIIGPALTTFFITLVKKFDIINKA